MCEKIVLWFYCKKLWSCKSFCNRPNFVFCSWSRADNDQRAGSY